MHKKRWGSPRTKSFFRSKKRIKSFDPSFIVDQQNRQNADTNTHYISRNSFSDFAFISQLQDNLKENGYLEPTAIQDQVIPLISRNLDVIGLARTGSGKTAAFLLPLINKIVNDKTSKILIITPTRELALQINEEFNKFVKRLNLFSVVCIGGVNIKRQIDRLIAKPDCVIGTPGRLKDLEGNRVIHFLEYNHVVLDEVDRLMDMGFMPDIKYLISRLPKERQSLFFSATMLAKTQEISHTFLKNPQTIKIHSGKAGVNVEQIIVKVNGKPKIDLLQELLLKEGFDKVLVFGRTKWGIEKLLRLLVKKGFRAVALHGNKKQNQRQRALNEFKYNRVKILLATDIASRGLDIDNVTHVINYDLPESYEDYIHRIGRTGRLDKKGTALTFVGN